MNVRFGREDMKILIAVLFWLLLLHVVNCQCRLNQTSEADCSQMKEPPTELPQPTLNSALKRLDISRNKVQKMGANFKKYTKLTTLIMRNVEYKEETLKREQWFADLKLLQELDITKLKYSNGELKTLDFTWPTSLVKLVVSNIGFETITGLKSLENLQELNATGNKLTLLPKLHPKSHIRSIFLENNPLEVIKVEEVAHLCFLKNLTIQIAPGGNFSTSLHHNCCKIFEKWMGQFRIQGHSSLTCSRDSPATQKSNCSSVTFPPEARALRDKCEGASLWDLLLYAVFFSIIFPILYFANETYNNYQEKTRIKQTKKPQLFTMTAESEQAVAQDSDHESQISTEDVENGFLCFAIICQESRPGCRDAKKSHCVRTVDKALEKITCSNNKVVKELPPLIDTKPKILNMSHNTYVSIGAANLAKLGSLERLFMSKIKHCDGQPIALETLFEPLKNLIELDISNLKIATKTLNISWPPKLKILNIAEMDINDVDGLQGLRHLMQLDARNNNLKVFPALNTSAPLEYINLEDNPLNLIEVSEVAPFCHLKSLGIRITKGGDLESERKYCTCMKLEKWLDKYVPDKNGLTCFRPKNKKSVPKCNGSIFADSDIRARLECQKDQASIFELLFYAIFFCILFPLFYFANEAYNNRMARKQQMAQTPEKSRRRKRKKIITTTSSPHFSETNPNEYEENFEKYNEEIVSLSA